MAQESAQGTGQANVQTVKVVRPYRSTDMGGFDRTYVLLPDGQIVKPAIRSRSHSGNHGWDEWHLGVGKYVIISASRPNLKNGARPYSVTIQCVEVVNGELKTITSRTMYVMEISNIKEWAMSICP
jgi:hypothetical protein